MVLEVTIVSQSQVAQSTSHVVAMAYIQRIVIFPVKATKKATSPLMVVMLLLIPGVTLFKQPIML